MKEIRIGRTPGNDIVIDDPSVSRSHAVLTIGDGDYYIRDLNSTNGTFVNGQRVQDSRRLEFTDIIKVGNSIIPWRNYLPQAEEKSTPVHAQTIHTTTPESPAATSKSRTGLGWILTSAVLIIGVVAFIVVFLVPGDRDKMIGTWYPVSVADMEMIEFRDNGYFNWEAFYGFESGTWAIDEKVKTVTLTFEDEYMPNRTFEYEFRSEKLVLNETSLPGLSSVYTIELTHK